MPTERGPRVLPYRKPTEGRDYWLIDDALPDALAVRERALARDDWNLGYPHRPESWPGWCPPRPATPCTARPRPG